MMEILTTEGAEDTEVSESLTLKESAMRDQILNVHYLPSQVAENELAGSTVVVIDLLRASTTICYALAAGASEVVPFRSIKETIAAAETVGRNRVVLGGERGGRRIEGFDLGNSPSEYTPKVLRGRPVYITTTNGTQALYHARLARRVVVGAMVNLSAVVASVQDEPRIDILCAGTDGDATGEDIIAAGAFVNRLREYSKARGQMNDKAAYSASCWNTVQNGAALIGRTLSEQLSIMLRTSAGGRNIIHIGLDRDLEACAQIDQFKIVPQLDVPNWRITA
jgi:2-phosphosulfolactate phosphatase